MNKPFAIDYDTQNDILRLRLKSVSSFKNKNFSTKETRMGIYSVYDITSKDVFMVEIWYYKKRKMNVLNDYLQQTFGINTKFITIWSPGSFEKNSMMKIQSLLVFKHNFLWDNCQNWKFCLKELKLNWMNFSSLILRECEKLENIFPILAFY